MTFPPGAYVASTPRGASTSRAFAGSAASSRRLGPAGSAGSVDTSQTKHRFVCAAMLGTVTASICSRRAPTSARKRPWPCMKRVSTTMTLLPGGWPHSPPSQRAASNVAAAMGSRKRRNHLGERAGQLRIFCCHASIILC